MNLINEMSLSFPSKSSNEAFARSAVSAFVIGLDPTVAELSDIKTAVSEAVTNCIVHGYRRESGTVYINGKIYENNKVVIKIRDKGCGIADIEKAMEPLFTTAPEEDRAGLGFAVMQSFCDKVKVKSTVGKGTAVTLEKVRFGYHDKEILHGVTMELKAGTVNAIVGPSGSGKSTIAKLIASLWDVDSGSIKIGGVDVKEMSLADFNRKIAYVAQDNYLFNETVRENIRQGNPEATDEQIIEVTKKSGCYEFIMQLENGFDTVVGGAGGHLSGGERQRISIARAMLKDAPIVILDEATAYTDPENEAILQNSIAKLVAGKTLIVIAHRLSTIKDSDQIFVVNDGNVTAHGTHEELLVSCPLYKEMWDAHISVKDTVKEGE